MPEVIEKYNLYDIGFDKFLSRKSYFDSDEYQEESSSLNSIFNATSPSLIGSGELIGNITMVNGLLQSSNFVTTVSGWKINYDGDVEFNEGTFRGALIAGSIHIPDENTTANSFHTNSTGNSWWGCTVDDFATDNNNANAYILNTGVAKFQNIILSSNVIISGIKAGSEIAIQNWSHNMVFSATDNDTVAWSAGSIKLLDGTIFSITAGNTGDITSITFIYLDVNTSETVLQITTTYSTAIGSNKILVCTCQNVAADKKAIFQVFSGKSLGGSSKLWTADDIAANSITANLVGTNEIIANTANIANAVISDAKITGTITVSHTDAKCTDADADQTSANQAATIASQGDLATTNEADANVLNMTNAPAAANADVTKTIIDGGLITTGYITLNTAGHIKSGQTAYGIGTGFWLGNDSGTPKFSIGNLTDYFKWTGSAISMLCSGENAITVGYGSDILLKEGGDINFTSVTKPTACTATLVVTGTGNIDNGTHYYKVTYVNDSGETELSDASTVVTVDATHKQVNLSNISTNLSSSVAARKIYRTKAGVNGYLLLTTISDNTTTTYTDNIADSSLTGGFADLRENDTFGKLFINGIESLSLGENVFIGQNSGPNNATGYHNTAIGYNSIYSNTTGYDNTVVGYSALGGNKTGYENVAIGPYALSYNTTGYKNTAIGYYAIHVSTEGYKNTAIGPYTLEDNTTGFNNVAIGADALKDNTTGQYNIAIGVEALDANTISVSNIAIGSSSLTANTAGDYCTAVGDNSLRANTTGGANTGIGTEAGSKITTGSSNTFLGNSAGSNASQKVDAENSMALGFGAYTDASNKIVVGNASITYIGGQVGWTTISDRRTKCNIEDYEHGLDLILKLKPVEFNMKDDKTNVMHSGFIAQEVEEIGIPFYGLYKPTSEEDKYALSYAEFVVPLVKAIQQQQQQIEELKNIINKYGKDI